MGRKPLLEHLPRIDIEVLTPEVQNKGLDAFERIGEKMSEVVERRAASIVVARVVRPKFVPKSRARNADQDPCRRATGPADSAGAPQCSLSGDKTTCP